jgi:uncharacterized cupredoxin-like copper-binding protein
MIRSPLRLITVLAAAAVLLAACGDGDSDSDTATGSGTRTIEIEMRDIEFSPDEVSVEPGETVRFVFENTGAIPHDAFIGDQAAQDEHEMEMRDAEGEDGGMDMGDEHGGDESGGITVEPGETGELTHTFREGDELLIGCHQAGHYEAGMRVMIDMG